MHHQCPGCSKLFRFKPQGGQCQRCLESVPKPRSQWATCTGCGRIFPFLDNNAECGECLADQPSKQMPPPDTVSHIRDAARYAMTHPANPRTHSSKENPHRGYYFNPLVALGKDLAVDQNKWDKHSQSASDILTAIGSSHSRAHARQSELPHSAKVPLAPPKIKGRSSSTPKPEISSNEPKIYVVVSKIEHRGRHGVRLFKDSTHEPVVTQYAPSTPWKSVVKNIQMMLDSVHAVIPYRVRNNSQFSLRYNTTGNSRFFLDDNHVKDTIAFLWANSISMPGNLLVSTRSEKSRILDLVAVVDYPPITKPEDSFDDGNETELQSTFLKPPVSRISKRKSDEDMSVASVGIDRPVKRTTLFVPSETQYYSKIALSLIPQKTTSYTVERFDLSFVHGKPEWTESPERFTVHVEDTYFSSGSTKYVYKLRCDSNVFAAKRFYNIGSGEDYGVANEDNYKHLQEELVRQFIVDLCAQKFQNLCEQNNIVTFDIEVEKGHILRVCDGPDTGLAWIVAPLLDHMKMKKFSGTDRAGCNRDLPGKTCDALAHFSLADSRNALVFVDVQGIISAPGQPQKVTLFDLMMHTEEQWCGLGDYGVPGIKSFISQHQCNEICKALNIPKAAHNYGINESKLASKPHVVEEHRSISRYTPPMFEESEQVQREEGDKAKNQAEGKKGGRTRSGKN